MVTRYISIIGLLVLTTGCSFFKPKPPEIRYITRTVTVEVPIPYVPTVPVELSKKYTPTLPTFIPPSSPEAVVALDKANTSTIKELINGLKGRLDAWEVWHRTLSEGDMK